MISDYQTNKVYFSEHLATGHPLVYHGLVSILESHKVAYDFIPCTKDIWCRDYMPLQLSTDRFVGYRYRPDYLLKSAETRKYITGNRLVCQKMQLHAHHTLTTVDGGNVVKVGHKVVMTEKVFAENPNVPKEVLTRRLERAFESEIVFLPWDRAEIYGHADGIVKPIDDETVLLTNYDDYDTECYNLFKERLSQVFHVETLHYDVACPHPESWSYINFLTVGRLIVMPKLNAEEDEQALNQIQQFYPDYAIEPLDVRSTLALGGGLNCITWCRLVDI